MDNTDKTPEALAKSEQYHRMLFENMLTGFARCEMIFGEAGKPVDFRYFEVNPMFEKLTGLKDVAGKLVSEVIPGVAESDPHLFEIYGRVATTGKPEQFEIYLEALKTWFSVSVYSVEKGFFTAVFDNITLRKEAEEANRIKFWFFESLDHVNRSILEAGDLEQMLSDVLGKVLTIFDCDRAWLLYPCDPDSSSFRVPMEISKSEYPGAKMLNVDVPMSPDAAQDMRDALASTGPIVYIAGTDRPINKVTAEQFGVQSQMLMSIHPKLGKPWVVGMHQCSHPRVWTAEEKWLFQEIGRRLTDGLTSLLSYRNLREGEVNLRKTMDELKNLMDAIPEVVYVLDTERNVVKWNRKAELISGYSAEELSHKFILELIPEQERPIVISAINEAYDKGRVEVEAHLLKKDGAVMPYRWSAAPMDDGKGNAIGIIGIGWDMSEQIKGEEALHTYQSQQRVILDTIPEVVWMKDTDGIYLAANEAFLIRVAKRRDEVIGKTDFDFFPSEFAEKFRADDKEVAESRVPKRLEESAPDPKGTIIWVETVKTPVYDDAGTLLGVAGVARDITDEKRLAALQEQKTA